MSFDPISYAMGAKSGGGGGSGGGVLVVHDVDGTLDKTVAEIAAADFAVIVNGDLSAGEDNAHMPIIILSYDNGEYEVGALTWYKAGNTASLRSYYAESENDYPVYD